MHRTASKATQAFTAIKTIQLEVATSYLRSFRILVYCYKQAQVQTLRKLLFKETLVFSPDFVSRKAEAFRSRTDRVDHRLREVLGHLGQGRLNEGRYVTIQQRHHVTDPIQERPAWHTFALGQVKKVQSVNSDKEVKQKTNYF